MEDLFHLLQSARRINREIRASHVPDITIKKALLNFVIAYNDIPDGDPAKEAQDRAALNLLKTVFGEGSLAIPAYLDFYRAAKSGEASIEQQYLSV